MTRRNYFDVSGGLLIRILLLAVLCAPYLSGCGARRPVVSDPEEIESDDEGPSASQKDIDQALKDALEKLYAARDAEKDKR
jgi:hypothetical protein